jgi:hypothetical protein
MIAEGFSAGGDLTIVSRSGLMNGAFEWLMVTEKIPKVPLFGCRSIQRGEISMVSAVHHPVTPSQAENVSAQPPVNRAEAKATRKPPAKPQPAQDSVKLSSARGANHEGSK